MSYECDELTDKYFRQQTEIECLRYEIRELQKQIDNLELFRVTAEFVLNREISRNALTRKSYADFRREVSAKLKLEV